MEYEKQTYYVSVAHRLVQDSPGDSSELKVLLDEEELSLLQNKLATLTAENKYMLQQTLLPCKSAAQDNAPEQFNKQLSELFVLLYRSGTAKTRSTLMESGVLSRLGNTDYHHPGYGEHRSPLNK